MEKKISMKFSKDYRIIFKLLNNARTPDEFPHY
jgi:hypothetical protein